MIRIIVANKIEHMESIRELSAEYLGWVIPIINDLYGIGFSIPDLLEKDMQGLDIFMPPAGRIILAFSDDKPAGIVGLKHLESVTGEIKRMYVRPEFRNQGCGRALVMKLIDEAKINGYHKLRLDSARFMDSAHRLYHSIGFNDIQPYEGSEIPKPFQKSWVFMEMILDR